MAETWVLNEKIAKVSASFNFDFKSNGQLFNGIDVQYVISTPPFYLLIQYNDLQTDDTVVVYNSSNTPAWTDEAYRTITFSTPTENLIQWLQSNATQQFLCGANDMFAVADAIRTKAGSTAALAFPDGFISAVNGIQTGGSGGQGPTPLNVQIATGSNEVALGICWQASNDWMFSTQFDTSTSFILPDVLIGGYVIFFIDPSISLSFILGDPDGAEVFEPVGFDSTIDTSRVCVVFKITSANPTVVVGVFVN